MFQKIQTYLLFLLIITTNAVPNKSNKTSYKVSKKHNFLKVNGGNDRLKRALSHEDESPFWPNRGKKQIDDDPNFYTKYNNGAYHQQLAKSYYKLDKDEPFWGNRGRRDSSSLENSYEYEYPEFFLKNCEHCVEFPIKADEKQTTSDRRDNFISPFWGSRGKRNSIEEDLSDPFWGNRGRRHEKLEPFWGNRGRRTENEPFWGTRGRREDEPFWGNRGRRDDIEPFWGNRGRRDNTEPFWGNRGRRQDSEPFWGNRGRRLDDEPFWGNRGRRKDSESSGSRNRKEDLKYSIMGAINNIEYDIDNLSRLKKSADSNSFWANRGRDNKLSLLFNTPSRTRAFLQKPVRSFHGQSFEPGTILDNRMYVDEPNFILVERSGRSSDEDDPFYISRGKKYYLNYSLEQATRDRRGAIEEIVKSVRNDPYYIARGKKDIGQQNGNATVVKDGYAKAKDLICAAIELITIKKDKVKREISDNERNRRTTLKKLAAQLQIDPYFVSRGKKSDMANDQDYLQEFISNVAENCN